MPERRRVAVTGCGPVTPLGIGVTAFWDGLLAARSAVVPITEFPTETFPCRIAASIPDFRAEEFIDPRRARRLARFSQFALTGALLALEDAGLSASDYNPTRAGVVIGTGIGGLGLAEKETLVLHEKGPRSVSPPLLAMMLPNAAAGSVAIELGYTGPNECTVTACAAGAQAIARAVDYIRWGAADMVLAGGTEAIITPLGIAAFCALHALSTRNHDPPAASRPFDAQRDGFVIGEGATVLVLEAMDLAVARGARIRGEIIGVGLSADAYNMTASRPDGAGAAAAMQLALDDAEIPSSGIGYINAHATSTRLGDAAEVAAIRKVFGDGPPPASSIKSAMGHLLGAAGAAEAAATLLAIQESVLPPTINYETPDPVCALDVVPNEARPCTTRLAMSNSFGFGGHNVSLVFSRCD